MTRRARLSGLMLGLLLAACESVDMDAQPIADGVRPVEVSVPAAPEREAAPDTPPPPDEPPEPVERTRSLFTNTRAHEAPEDAPSAVVHTPPGFDTSAAYDLVVYLHGWNGCVDVLARSGEVRCRPSDILRPGWGITDAHDAWNRPQTALYFPQLGYRTRSGDPGRLGEAGVADAMLDEALAAYGLPRDGLRHVYLASHSAGFHSAMTIMRASRWPIQGVVLFDSLYGRAAGFADWVAADPTRRLLSIYAPDSTTERQSRRLRGLLGPVARDVRFPRWPERARAVMWVSEVRHQEMPATLWDDALGPLIEAAQPH